MNSKRHKVVHEVCGKPMIAHIVSEMQAVGFDRLFVVVGRLESQVRDVLGDEVSYIRQEEQLGTGHAVQQVIPYLPDNGITVVLYGDCPLVRREEIARLMETAEKEKATSLMTAVLPDPYSYGRIIRSATGAVTQIVEEKDATLDQRLITEVNTGIYAFWTPSLRAALPRLTSDNAQGELLLTDCVKYINQDGGRVVPVIVKDADDIANVNDRVQLSVVEQKMRRRIILRHMQAGVTVIDPATTYIEADVLIGRDTVIWPGSYLKGLTSVGEDCVIGPNARLENAIIKDEAIVDSSVIVDSTVDSLSHVGPFAYIRPGSFIGQDVKIGDFVEIKNSTIGNGTKVSHLAYVGDSDVGASVNIGCGVVTVNYDGYQKHRTVIEDGSFVGSNVNLIAPVTVGKEGYVATGSTITDDVADGSFAIARERQTTKPAYAAKLRERLRQKDGHRG